MKTLPAAALLDLWEHGSSQPPALAAVAVLSAASGEPREAIRRLPVGERDLRLLALQRELRGRNLEGVASCPACGTLAETSFDLDALRAALVTDDAPIPCSHGRHRATVRRPTTDDVLAASSREELLRRCISVADAPDALLDAAEEALERADPAADIRLALTCPDCGHEWTVLFDVAAFLWREVTLLAERLAEDVHLLALAYGWSERDILALTPARRQLYLQRAAG